MIPEKNIKKIIEVLEELVFLDEFKKFCKENEDNQKKQKLRNIFYNSNNKKSTAKNIFSRRGIKLMDEEAERMYALITCFLNKSEYRKKIDENIKKKLLIEQDYKCEMCGKKIDIEAHADHIIPFSLVGDELENNLQMLCADCNKAKYNKVNMGFKKLMNLVKEEYNYEED